ncbi:MAG: T9SS type A sorting domain-containing protein [Flavobacteriales bacterium]
MKHIFITTCFVQMMLYAAAQTQSPSAIGSAGKSFSGSYGSHHFTAGQSIIGAATAVDATNTHGFHQPWAWSAAIAAVANDAPGAAANAPLSGNAYPSCGLISGTALGATPSAQDVAFAGADAWYKFTAASTACRINLDALSGTMDGAIAIYGYDGFSYTLMPSATENATGAGAIEILNYDGLTTGTVYYLAVGAASLVTAGGPFTLCIQHLMHSACNDGDGSYNLCSNLKPEYTGANSYVFSFTQTLPAGGTTSASSTGQIALSNALLALHHSYAYSVNIDAVYSLLDGNSVSEIISVASPVDCSISITPHADLRTKVGQRCPASVLKGSVLQAKPFVCAAINHTVEFTEVMDCTGSPVIGLPFTAATSGSSSSISLSGIAGVLSGHWYAVRWRPNFGYGAGIYGTVDIIQVSASMMQAEIPDMPDENKLGIAAADLFNIYPNPSGDGVLNIAIAEPLLADYMLQVVDATGRICFQTTLRKETSGRMVIEQTATLSNGVYVVTLLNGGESQALRWVISK